jgi:hypothetical protein
MYQNISILQQRGIEAAMAKLIYEAMRDEIGEERAKNFLSKAVRQAAIEAGRTMADKEGGQTGTRSLEAIQSLWKKGNALETTTLALDDNVFHYTVSRCAYATMYREIGLSPDLGFILSCLRDEAFIKGYAPELELVRTQTIMEGGAYCDFCYRKKLTA